MCPEIGYTLPLKAFPATALSSNNRSALRNSDFVQDAIEKLLRNRCIVETVSPPRVVNPLSVSEGKKLRLVLDLRYVNQFLQKQSFRYEDLKTLSEVFQQGYYFFTFDLESGYHHVSMIKSRKSPTVAWFLLDFSKWKDNFLCFSCPAFRLIDGLLFVYQIIEATGCPMKVDGSRLPSLYR